MTDTPTSAPSAPAAPAPVDPAPINPTTPHEARVRIDALTSNKEWGKRWLEGGIAEHKEYQRLSALADQADEVKDAIAGTTPEPNLIETVSPGQLNSRDLASTVEMFRDSGLTDDVIHQAMRGSEVSEVFDDQGAQICWRDDQGFDVVDSMDVDKRRLAGQLPYFGDKPTGSLLHDRGTVPQGIASGDAHEALDQHRHAGGDLSRHEQCVTRGIAPNLPKAAKTIDLTRLKLRKHLLAARIERRHVEPRSSAGNESRSRMKSDRGSRGGLETGAETSGRVRKGLPLSSERQARLGFGDTLWHWCASPSPQVNCAGRPMSVAGHWRT